jgi:hypothetical protein
MSALSISPVSSLFQTSPLRSEWASRRYLFSPDTGHGIRRGANLRGRCLLNASWFVSLAEATGAIEAPGALTTTAIVRTAPWAIWRPRNSLGGGPKRESSQNPMACYKTGFTSAGRRRILLSAASLGRPLYPGAQVDAHRFATAGDCGGGATISVLLQRLLRRLLKKAGDVIALAVEELRGVLE